MRHLIACAVVLCLGSYSFAETWTVDDDGPADFSHIQDAIDAASDGDEIVVMPGMYSGTGSNAIVRPNGKEITLRSLEGPHVTIIDGPGAGSTSRWGIVCEASETEATVIEGFTIQNCVFHGANGGGIVCKSSSPTFKNCISLNNGGSNGEGYYTYYGGGLYLSGANSAATFIGCTFEDNFAYFSGGGVYCDSQDPVFLNCTFTSNSCQVLWGGGLYFSYADPTLIGCLIQYNSAITDHGGGISQNGGAGTFISCTYDSNTADSTDSNGGGYYSYYSDANYVDCLFTNNTAGTGGAVYDQGYSFLSFHNCTFDGNSASYSGGGIFSRTSGEGGGIYFYAGSSVITVTNCDISGNTSGGSGGGLFLSSCAPQFDNCSISNNHSFGNAGGAYCTGGSPILNSCTVESNTSIAQGGAFYCENNSNPTLNDCAVRLNTSADGGGIYSQVDSNPTAENTVICGNVPDQVYGRWTDAGGSCIAFRCDDEDDDGSPDECGVVDDGIHQVPEEFATIQDAIIAAGQGDTVLVGPGTWTADEITPADWVINPGGKTITILASDGPESTILDGEGARRVVQCAGSETPATVIEGFTITNGYSEELGGGVYCYTSSPTLTNCILTENTVSLTIGFGGGLGCIYSSSPQLNGCTVSLCSAQDGGGIACWYESSPVLTDCTISTNTSIDDGAGIYCSYSSNISLEGCSVVNNTSEGDFSDGVGIYSFESQLTIDNSNISNNISEGLYGDGGGIYLINSDAALANSVLDGNISGSDYGRGGGMFCSNSSPSLTDCQIYGNSAGSVSGDGGGIACWSDSNVTLYGTEIRQNQAYIGGGLSSFTESTPMLQDAIVCGNTPEQIYGDWSDNGGNDISDVCAANCRDVNGDGNVGVDDLLYIIAAWGSDDPLADLNEDGIVGVDDLLLLIGAWGPCP
jgi:hypothetical protein